MRTTSRNCCGVVEFYVVQKYSDLDPAFVTLINNWGQTSNPPVVKIDDVYVMKLLCETIYRDVILPNILRRKQLDESSRSEYETKR